MYLNQAPSSLRAFTNCFMRPSLICSGGSITLDLSTIAGCKIFLKPGVRDSLNGQSRLMQCLLLSLLSHSHIEQGYFVNPDSDLVAYLGL